MNVKSNTFLIIFFLLMFCSKNGKNPIITDFDTPVLSYKHVGWAGRITFIKVDDNKNGTKIRDEKETTIKFTTDEKIKLDSLIVQFPEFERTYKPEIGTCCDIDFFVELFMAKL
jgi:hypothetical protein